MPVNTTQVSNVVMTDTFTQFKDKTNEVISIVNGLPGTGTSDISRLGGTIDGEYTGAIPQGLEGSLFIISDDGGLGIGNFLASGEPTTTTTDQIHILKTGTGATASINVVAQGTGTYANLSLMAVSGTAPHVAAIRLMEHAETGMVIHYSDLDRLDIKGVNSAVETDLFTFTRAGRLGIGTTDPKVDLHIFTPSNVGLSPGAGMLMLGEETGPNIIIDRNEILARSDATTASTLFLQHKSPGGNLDLVFGGGDLIVGAAAHGSGSAHRIAYFDANLGRVGININTPAKTLDVFGTFQASGDSLIGGTLGVTDLLTLSGNMKLDGDFLDVNNLAGAPLEILTSKGGAGAGVEWMAGGTSSSTLSGPGVPGATSGKLAKWTGAFSLGDSVIVEDGSGNIGIGGTPWGGAEFNVIGTTNPQMQISEGTHEFIRIGLAAGGGKPSLAWDDGNASGFHFGTLTNNIQATNFLNSLMTIQVGPGGLAGLASSGSANVGIGTTSPGAALHVNATPLGTGTIQTTEIARFGLKVTNSDSLRITSRRLTGGGSDWQSSRIKLHRQVDSDLQGYIQFGYNQTTTGTGNDDDSDLITFGWNSTEYMRITRGGNVGIGTFGQLDSSNEAKVPLHIMGGASTVTVSGGGMLLLGDLGADNVILDANEIQARDNGAWSSLYLQYHGGQLFIGGNSTATHYIGKSNFGSSNGNRVATFNGSNGQVGINIDIPLYPLHVSGNTGFSTTGIEGSAIVRILDTVEAFNSTSGALRVSGGVGIAKKLFVGTALDVGTTLDVSGTTTLATVSTARINTTTGAVMWGWTESTSAPTDGSQHWRGGIENGYYFIDYDRTNAGGTFGTYRRTFVMEPQTLTGSCNFSFNLHGPGLHLLHANTNVTDDGIYLEGSNSPRFTVVDTTSMEIKGVFRSTDAGVEIGSFSNDPFSLMENSTERMKFDGTVATIHRQLYVGEGDTSTSGSRLKVGAGFGTAAKDPKSAFSVQKSTELTNVAGDTANIVTFGVATGGHRDMLRHWVERVSPETTGNWTTAIHKLGRQVDETLMGYIGFGHNAGTGRGNNITFGSGSSEYMVLDKNGNVGIGETSPLSLLHISKFGDTGGPGTSQGPTIILEQTDPSIIGNQGLGHIEFRGDDPLNAHSIGAKISASAFGSWDGSESPASLSFMTTPDNTTTPESRMTIRHDGKIGINEQLPDQLLHITGATDGTNPQLLIQEGSGITEYVRLGIESNQSTLGWHSTKYMRFGTFVGLGAGDAFTERMRITNSGEVLTSGGATFGSLAAPVRAVDIIGANGQQATFRIQADTPLLELKEISGGDINYWRIGIDNNGLLIDQARLPGASNPGNDTSPYGSGKRPFTISPSANVALNSGPNATSPSKLSVNGAIAISEQSSSQVSATSHGGYGQIWVKSTTPSSLMFTDDTGADHGPIERGKIPGPTISDQYFEQTGIDLPQSGVPPIPATSGVFPTLWHFAHGLGTTPRILQVCLVGIMGADSSPPAGLDQDLGYRNGDEVNVNNIVQNSGSSAISYWANSTYASIHTEENLFGAGSTVGAVVLRIIDALWYDDGFGGEVPLGTQRSIDTEKWQYTLRAWK